MCTLFELKTLLHEKTLWLQNKTELAKCMPAVLWFTNYCGNATSREWLSGFNYCSSSTWNGCKISPYNVRCAVVWDLTVAMLRARTLVSAFNPTPCNRTSSNISARDVSCRLVLSIETLNDPCFATFRCTQTKFIIRLPPSWIFLPTQSNSKKSIFVGEAVDEVNIHQLGFRIMDHGHWTLSIMKVNSVHRCYKGYFHIGNKFLISY